MKVNRLLIFIAVLAVSSGTAFAGEGVSKATIDEYRQLKSTAEKLVDTKAGKYAADIIEKVKSSVSKAQQAIEAGDEKVTKQALEIANLQITLAKVTADQREATENTKSARAELKKHVERLDSIMAGKGDVK